MTLPFIMGRKSQTASVETSYEKLFTQLFVHSARLLVTAHDDRGLKPRVGGDGGSNNKTLLCTKLLNNNLAGKKKK